MKSSLEPPDTQRFIYISVGLVTLCVQSLLLLMATEGQSQLEATTANTAVWTEPETDALMNYFLAEKATLGDSGVFKKHVFQAAAEGIRHLHTSGPAKTAKHCKTKYTSVRNIPVLEFHC
jgi:hypothetical protein